MSRKQTQFIVLPNEVIYCIFDFLKTSDILRAFTHLNHRYDNLVRFYIKRIDLTNDWEGNRYDFKWICKSIQTLKVDQYYAHWLNDLDNEENATSSSIKETVPQRNQKSLFRSLIKRLFTSAQKATIAGDRFLQLHSLHLVNVSDWNKVISGMNLETLNLWLDDDNHYHSEETVIPKTIIRFSANTVLKANNFHTHLIDLNVCVRSVVHLLEIIEHTPNIQHLSITFADNFDHAYCIKNYQSDRFETMITNYRPLNNLNRLSFSTKLCNDAKSNERLQFYQIQFFIDRCCPHKGILKRVTLKLEYIMFDKEMWSTIVGYKNTFDRFDFYASFIAEDKASIKLITSSINHHFTFHVEDGDPLHSQARFVHIYSLPFLFDKLHGFISCFELNTQCSFFSVRHLYLTKARLARPISFESLSKRMPHLISIACNFSFAHGCNVASSPFIFDGDIFNYIRFLRFTLHCLSPDCVCHSLLPRLIDRMPHLQSLVTSEKSFEDGWHPLPPIRRLDLRQCEFTSFDSLAEHVPHLSTLLICYMISSVKDLSHILGSLYMGIPSLKVVSIKVCRLGHVNRSPFEKIAKQAMVRVQKMDNRLHHLTLNCQYGVAEFFLRNS